MLGPRVLTVPDVEALAEVPPRDVLLAQLAGGFQAPLVKAAGLFQAFTRNLAYGLKALHRHEARARRPLRRRGAARRGPSREAPAAAEPGRAGRRPKPRQPERRRSSRDRRTTGEAN